MPAVGRNSVEPSLPSSRRGTDTTGGDGGDSIDSTRLSEPPTRHSRLPGDDGGGSGIPRVFEVTFPATGPLGITFEWAVDSTAVALPPTGRLSTATDSMHPLVSPRAGRRQERLLGMINTTTPSSGGGGGTPETTSRALPLNPSTLPPISSSPSSAPKDGAGHSLEPPLAPALLPYALRIQSFPRLPPQEPQSLHSVIPGGRITAAAGGDSSLLPGGEVEPPAATTSSDRAGFLNLARRSSGDKTHTHEEEECPGSNIIPYADAKFKHDTPLLVEGNNTEKKLGAATIGTTEQLGDISTISPVEGRDLLRPGDVLVEVNGTPVAGPAARDAGVMSFEDAVRVVAAATEAPTATTANTGMKQIGGPRQRPRVFKFRREAQFQRPTSACSSTSTPRILPRAPKLTSKGGWVKGMSGSALASGSSSRTAADTQGTTESSSRSTSVGESGTQVGMAANAACTASSPRLSSSSLCSVLQSQRSVSPRGSEASFVSRRSSRVSRATRSRKRGIEGKGVAGSSVFSAKSAAERIKAEAR